MLILTLVPIVVSILNVASIISQEFLIQTYQTKGHVSGLFGIRQMENILQYVISIFYLVRMYYFSS